MTESVQERIPGLLPQSELSAEVRDEMFGLLSRHFDGVTRTQFDRDLAEKNWVILLRQDSSVVGFSTLLLYESCFEDQVVSVVYSGDTIVSPEAWGSPTLARAWIASVNWLRQLHPRGDYYWLLLTSGFRTYRFLPVFWREFHPRFDASVPARQGRLLDHLATERFGAQYLSAQGIVRFRHPQRLRSGFDIVPEGRLADPHTAFFLSRNPGHRQGDELVCLTELTEQNLTRAGWRMVGTRTHEPLCNHR